jgi:hypothetical protein
MDQGLKTPVAKAKISNSFSEKDTDMQEFLLYFSPSTSGTSLLEAIHALYYLPQNYKLLLTDRTAIENDMITNWAMQNIMNRIRFEDEGLSEQQQTSPFSYADAVIASSTTDPNFAHIAAPLLVVSDDSEDDIAYNERHGFNVRANNPEALASAILRIARARA